MRVPPNLPKKTQDGITRVWKLTYGISVLNANRNCMTFSCWFRSTRNYSAHCPKLNANASLGVRTQQQVATFIRFAMPDKNWRMATCVANLHLIILEFAKLERLLHVDRDAIDTSKILNLTSHLAVPLRL